MLDFGGNFNKSSFLFWLLEFTAVGFFTVGIEPFAAEKICKKNCTENLHLCISRASYASLVTQSIQSLVGILIVLVLPFKKWKLKCFSWQLVNSVCQNVLGATGKIRFFVLCGYIRLALVWNVEVVRETFSWRKITNRCRPKSALEKDKFSTWSLVNHNQNSTKLILFVTCCFNCFSLSWFSTDYISSQEFI